MLPHWRLTRWFIAGDGQIYAFYIIHADHRRVAYTSRAATIFASYRDII